MTMAIDMFYWGERRMLREDDLASYRERPVTMSEADIRAFNQRASQDESLVGRSLFTAGITWPGVILWDDIRRSTTWRRAPRWTRRGWGVSASRLADTAATCWRRSTTASGRPSTSGG